MNLKIIDNIINVRVTENTIDLINKINELESTQAILLYDVDHKKYLRIQSLVSRHKACFNKEVSTNYDKKAMTLKILPFRSRAAGVSKRLPELIEKKREQCISSLLSDRL